MLETATSDTAGFVHRPGPGVYASALDWQVVLGTGADLIAYAGVLWAAYEKFVKPRRKKHKGGQTQALLFVNVRQPRGDFAQFALGLTYTNRDAFIEAFVSLVAALRAADGQSTDELIAELDGSYDWVRTESDEDVQR
jgi:hypothetical protein